MGILLQQALSYVYYICLLPLQDISSRTKDKYNGPKVLAVTGFHCMNIQSTLPKSNRDCRNRFDLCGVKNNRK